jgi:hypothetical protein
MNGRQYQRARACYAGLWGDDHAADLDRLIPEMQRMYLRAANAVLLTVRESDPYGAMVL